MAGAPKFPPDGGLGSNGPFGWVRPNFFEGVPQVLNAEEFVAAWYGVQVRTRNRRTDTTVSTTAIQLDAYPRQRAMAVFSNTGSNPCVIDANENISFPNGIYLNPGMAVIINIREDWQLIEDPFWGIVGGGGNTTIHCLEVVFAGA